MGSRETQVYSGDKYGVLLCDSFDIVLFEIPDCNVLILTSQSHVTDLAH